jgi:hypothetical protein
MQLLLQNMLLPGSRIEIHPSLYCCRKMVYMQVAFRLCPYRTAPPYQLLLFDQHRQISPVHTRKHGSINIRNLV